MVADARRRNREPTQGGIFSPDVGIRGVIHCSCRDVQVSTTDVRPVGQRLAGVLQECLEGALSLELARETSNENRGRPASVSNVLPSSGTDVVTIWHGDLDFV